MPRFFVPPPVSFPMVLTGETARHISRSLRMSAGEELTLCDGEERDYHCEIESVGEGSVTVTLLSEEASRGEPSLFVTLYQGLPKSDKFELIVQKAVELGVSRIVPTLMDRCISRPDSRSMEKKVGRWQKIALEAAKQCGRGRIPEVAPLMPLAEAAAEAKGLSLLFYEGGGAPLSSIKIPPDGQASIFIGPEGGFAPEETELLLSCGAAAATLGPRILRTETAPLAALSVLMYQSGNLE